ncbi:MAG: YgeY family selenium metabolism-linked hydrolase [Oscillospiraceae bacterium]
MLNEKRITEITEFCQSLIQNQSYSGNEQKVANVLSEKMTELGFDEIIKDKYGNIYGHIKGNKNGKKILFDGHMDTVITQNPELWEDNNPFSGKIKDGKLYGRGSSDMKCALGAMVMACGYFAKDTCRDFFGDIYVAGVVHEECFEGVAARESSKNIEPDYVVIGEASSCNLKIAQRGRAEIVVETFGKPAHSASPKEGINAVYKMTKLIDEIQKITPPHHEILGDGILELTDIKSSPYPGASVVPDYCKATYDRRLLVGETKESVLEPIVAIIKRMEEQDSQFSAKVSFAVGKETCYTGEEIQGERFFPAWLFDKKQDYIEKIYEGLLRDGLTPEITQYNFCTNGSHYAGEKGIKTIGLGPSLETLAHTDNEYVEIQELLKAAKSYYSILTSLLTQ